MAGQSQLPAGSFAFTSILPYFMRRDSVVVSLALRTGLITMPSVALLATEHAVVILDPSAAVQLPSPAVLVRLRRYPLSSCAAVILVDSVVKVGTICRPASSTYALSESVVVQSKDPVPKPSSWTSLVHLLESSVANESSQYGTSQNWPQSVTYNSHCSRTTLTLARGAPSRSM